MPTDDVSALASLLARIEALSGPDREVDCDLTFLFDRPQYAFSGGPVPREEVDGVISPAYTASLDSALALVERVRPGWYPELCKNYRGADPPRVPAWSSAMYSPDRQDAFETAAATPALALLAALIKSLQHAD